MLKKLLASLALALLVLAGCSDSDEPSVSTDGTESSGSSSEPSDDEPDEEAMALDDWIEEADAICEEADEEFEALGEPENDEEFVEFLEAGLELFGTQLEDLQALGVPDDKADEVEEALDLLEEQGEIIEEALAIAEEEGAEAAFEVMDEGEEIDDELEDLAADIGLEVCGAPDEDTTDTTEVTDDTTDTTEFTDDTMVSDDAYTYGDDSALDALWDECDGGNGVACDELYWTSPLGSEYESFGSTCGDRFDEASSPASCEEELGGEKIEDDGGDGGGTSEPMNYGDDPTLDALYDDCAAGDMVACDDLFWDSPLGSEYEAFGNTCGEIYSEAEVPFSCAEGE